MGNAVSAAKRSVKSNKTFTVPWRGKSGDKMVRATSSGKTLTSDQILRTDLQLSSDDSETKMDISDDSQTSVNLGAKDITEIVNLGDARGSKFCDEIIGQQILKKPNEQDVRYVYPPGKNQPIAPAPAPAPAAPKPDVRFVFLQPGQKLSDINLVPIHSSEQAAAQTTQPGHVVYLNKIPVIAAHSPSFPSQDDNRSPRIPNNTPVKSSPTSGILPSPVTARHKSPDSVSVPSDRAKDVVPGTGDRYRTPGSSFRNKNGNVKRPMNAFMVWARTYRAKLASRFNTDTNSQISMKLGDVWNSLTREEKQPYYDQADLIKNQHKKEFPDWVYRPSPSKKRQEESATHNVLWARFGGGSSAATLARIATAAANHAPLESLQKDAPRGQPRVVGRQIGAEAQGTLGKMQENQHQGRQDTVNPPDAGRTLDNPRTPDINAREVLKAKLSGQTRTSHGNKSPEKPSPHSASGTSPSPKRNSTNLPQHKSPVKIAKNKTARTTVKKKKTSRANAPREDDKHLLDHRPKSPGAPPTSPRSTVSLDSPKKAGEKKTSVTDQKRVNSPAERTGGETYRLGEEEQGDDSWPFPFPPYQYGPFDTLSPKDVPSDEILGMRAGRARESDEDSSRPERVTSDLYLDVHRWRSFLTSSGSNSKLTDEDVYDIFNPSHCDHGPDCRVCTSDVDLAPKSLRDTLRVGKDGVFGNPNVCLEVDFKVGPDYHKPEEDVSAVDRISGAVCEALKALNEPDHVGNESPGCGAETSIVMTPTTSSSPTMIDRETPSDSKVASDSETSDVTENGHNGISYVDIGLSTDLTTHVMFKPTSESSRDDGETPGRTDHLDKRHNRSACIACCLVENAQEQLKRGGRMKDASPTDDPDLASEMPRSVRSLRSAPGPRQRQVYKMDDSNTRMARLAPDVTQLIPVRSSDSESQMRSDLYHRKIQLHSDISKYKIFDTNKNASEQVGSRRLKSAQLARGEQTLKLRACDGEGVRGRGSLSLGNMSADCSLDVELDSVEGTVMRLGEREGGRKATRNRGAAFPCDDDRKPRGKKTSKSKSLESGAAVGEADMCRGDSISRSTQPTSPTKPNMEILKTLIVTEKDGLGCAATEDIDKSECTAADTERPGCPKTDASPGLNERTKWNRRQSFRNRSQMTSRIYASRQTLSLLHRGRMINNLARPTRSKPR
ncbi:uncharacterized protein LOC124136597 isoform X1 [Haliotis rufescens]|uniref:uncharacterized protein LOC124136597 isoform X1 n=1 Tax=Haliotis rufescens TaxID=6454 RepID=UPI00201F715E|nr:uncharacterized protein LOC124136597 isoform X1 [Haliotis rufescens]